MKKLTLFFLFLLIPLNAFAAPKLVIFDWQETTDLNKNGKNSKVLMQGQIQGVASNQAMTSFSINFSKKQNIKINRAAVDSKLAEFTFANNILNVKFTKPKLNNELVSIYFNYDEKYDEIYEYLRQELIYIPDFASGAKASVIINFPGELESATLNPNITKNGNAFIYRSTVPKGGVQEIIKLTPSQNIWDVKVKIKVSSGAAFGRAIIYVPLYFQSPSQRVDNSAFTTSIAPTSQSIDNGRKVFDFKTTASEILIEDKARITTGKNYRVRSLRNPDAYKRISAEDKALMEPILEKIKQDTKYKNLPLYARIGKYVNEYIKYDESYVGKLPTLKQILQNPIGVCTEYANLYNALARTAGIPSVIVNGGSCGEYDKCRGHAWNIIFYNDQWIDVDPTWDLMSGIVSSSHVYLSDEGKGSVETLYYNRAAANSQMDFEMKKVQ